MNKQEFTDDLLTCKKEFTNSNCSLKNGIPSFFAFIVLLRAMATCLITNTHMGSVYPIAWFAVGGLIGDALFFIVSGFCLAEIENAKFFKWYGKRLLRIYPSVLLASVIFCIIGRFQVDSVYNFLYIFLYPTKFPFIGNIILLYIFFYITLRITFLRQHIPQVMIVLAVCWLILYVFLVDKSIRIDTAEFYLTKFLFFEAMLYGAYVRMHIERYYNNNKWWKWCLFISGLLLYLGSKLIIDKFNLMNLQFIIILFVFLITVACFVAFIGIERYITKLGLLYSVAKFLAPLTLEIYIVQHYIIGVFINIKELVFPFNFILILTTIVVSALVVNRFIHYSKKVINLIVAKIRNKKIIRT